MDFEFQNFSQGFLFWAHIVFIFVSVAVGFFVSPLLVAFLVAFHRIHVFFFGECILSKMQRKIGGLPENVNFLQLAVKKFFRKEISPWESRLIDYCLAGSILVVAIIR